jgi:hypothetical protein
LSFVAIFANWVKLALVFKQLIPFSGYDFAHRGHKEQVFSVFPQGPLVSQEGPCIMNFISSKIMKSVERKSCTKQLIRVRCNKTATARRP